MSRAPERNHGARSKWNPNSQVYKGYSLATLMRVNLPPSIKCSRCKKTKRLVNANPGTTNINFSQRVLTEIRYKVHTKNTDFSDIECATCSGVPISEVTCSRCEKTKGLNEFSARQRTFGEDRQCKACVTEVEDGRLGVDSQRVITEDYRSLSAPSQDDSDEDESVAGTERTNFNTVTDDSVSEALSDMHLSTENQGLPLGNGVRITYPAQTQSELDAKRSAASQPLTTSTNLSSRGTSAVGSSTVWGYRSDSADNKVGKSGWAKIKSGNIVPAASGSSRIDDDDDLPSFCGGTTTSRAPDSDSDGDWD